MVCCEIVGIVEVERWLVVRFVVRLVVVLRYKDGLL